MSTASAVLGTLALLAVVLSLGLLFFVALPMGLVAILLAVVARRKGMRAMVGLVTGVLRELEEQLPEGIEGIQGRV